MGTFRLLARRAAALAALSLSAALAGCASYPASYYSGETGYGDYYYADDYDYRDRYRGGFAYQSIFWPTWGWYDPWYSPGHYYGINYSPGWFGLSFGYGGYGGYPWRYHHYSPYRNSWWDNHAYYGGTSWRHGYRDRSSGYRFGSARNEAERIARAEGVRPQYGDAGVQSYAPQAYRGDRSRGIDYGDGRVRHDARDAAWRDAQPGAYARERSAPRSYDWRTREGDRGTAPRVIDSRAFGAGRPEYGRASRDLPHGADAYSRSRDMTPYYDRPMPRERAPQYAAPRSESFGGARPSGPSRSYSAPSPGPSRSFSPPPSPPPRVDMGGSSRGESSRSREPD